MKNTVKILTLVLALVLAMSVFVGCKKTLSGEYEAMEEFTKSGMTIKFTKSTATITVYLFGEEVVSTDAGYEIDDGKIEFDFDDIDEDDWDMLEKLEDEVSFEELENGDIKIGGETFKKK